MNQPKFFHDRTFWWILVMTTLLFQGLMVIHDQVISVIDNCDLKTLVRFSEILQESTANQQTKSVALAIQNKVSLINFTPILTIWSDRTQWMEQSIVALAIQNKVTLINFTPILTNLVQYNTMNGTVHFSYASVETRGVWSISPLY